MSVSMLKASVTIGLLKACLAVLALLPGSFVAAAPFPDRPIRLIVTFPPGGSIDTVARVMRPVLEKRLGQPVVVENRSGAGGTIGIEAVTQADPDGYTIGVGGAGALAISVTLDKTPPYDPLTELSPIALIEIVPFVLAASPSFPAKSLGEVIALAKARPNTISVAHPGAGTALHLAAVQLNAAAGISLSLVPYRGSGPIIADLTGDHVPLGVVDGPAALAQIRSGKLRALAISSRRRIAAFDGIPTFDEQGLKGFEAIGWFGIVAPAGTPPQVVTTLNAAIVAALNEPDVGDVIRTTGGEVRATTPEEFSRFIRSEIGKWRDIALDAGLPVN